MLSVACRFSFGGLEFCIELGVRKVERITGEGKEEEELKEEGDQEY